jgi:subtilisin family serine protease
MKSRWILLAISSAFMMLLGYWLARTAMPTPITKDQAAKPEVEKTARKYADEDLPKFRSEARPPSPKGDREALEAGALLGQRTLVFKDQASLLAFLKRAGDRVKILGQIDALHALRVGFSSYDDLASLLDGSEALALIFPMDIPQPANGSAQAGAVPLGAGLLEWLGITGDNSQAGKGVKVAIIDTGVTAHKSFTGRISWIDLVPLPADLSKQNGHGTAVASMIAGNSDLTPGVAPQADMLSIRAVDDSGRSYDYTIAQAIIAAVDHGAILINISSGSPNYSSLIASALDYAESHGAVVIAPAGNNGVQKLSYPAANKGVVPVGGVDALGNHLDFSNTGSAQVITAPGYGVNAAYTENRAASVSGTSYSAPIVTGAVAWTLSLPGNEKLTARQAVDVVYSYLNDSGSAGPDQTNGSGMVDLGRVANGTKPGVFDAAVASQQILPPSPNMPYGEVEVLVQNRGTETLTNTGVQISTPNGIIKSNVTSLGVGAVQTIRIPISQRDAASFTFTSTVNLSNGLKDAKPSNDRRSDTYVPVTRQ